MDQNIPRSVDRKAWFVENGSKRGPFCAKIGTINIYLDHDTNGLRLDIMNPADKDGDYVNISLFE